MIQVIGPAVAWWAVLTAVGVAAFPIVRRLLWPLSDRGLSVARPAGLLMAGWLWWIAVTAGLLPNSAVGAWSAVFAVGVVGARVAWLDREMIAAELRRLRGRLIAYEVVFAVALVAWVMYRAFYPDVTQAGGEKTMELAFLSGILESERFPPNDPWMAGKPISYYYFSYVIGAMLVQMTGLMRTVAFNLLVPGTLAMTLIAAGGLAANMVLSARAAARKLAVATSTLGAGALAILGSLEGFLEVGYRIGWPPRSVFQHLAIFDIGGHRAWIDGRLVESADGGPCGKQDAVYNELARAAANVQGFTPTAADLVPDRHIWWWRASRVIRDACTETIHEFPFFSFMLADAHPHVLAIPFVIVVLSLAFALLLGAARRYGDDPLRGPLWWFIPLAVGGLAFMNAWDLPTYGLVLTIALILWIVTADPLPLAEGWTAHLWRSLVSLGGGGVGYVLAPLVIGAVRTLRSTDALTSPAEPPLIGRLLLVGAGSLGAALLAERLREAARNSTPAARAWTAVRLVAGLAVLSWVLYAPFYATFSSQATGLGMVQYSSRPSQWMVHWAPLWFLGVSTATLGVVRAGRSLSTTKWLGWLGGTFAALLLPALLGMAGWTIASWVAVAAAVLVVLGRLQQAWDEPRHPDGGPDRSVRLFLTVVVVLGSAAMAWRSDDGPVLAASEAMGGGTGWTPWTPLLITVPLVMAAAAGLELWLASRRRSEAPSADPPAEGPAPGEDQPAGEQDVESSSSALRPDSPPSSVSIQQDPQIRADAAVSTDVDRTEVAATCFALLLVTVGFFVVLGTEFVLIRDLFSSRMNTIFKLHFQGWVLVSIGGAFALPLVWWNASKAVRWAWVPALVLLVLASSVYPLAATWDRTGAFGWTTLTRQGIGPWAEGLTLDGVRYWEQAYPDDLAGARWLAEHATGTPNILEGTGGGYSHTGRIAMVTGFPTVLGPDGHEHQWRGTREEIDPRKAEIGAFYGGELSAEEMRQLLERHRVEYVIVGGWERAQHGVPPVVERRLDELMERVFSQGDLTIYARPGLGRGMQGLRSDLTREGR